MQLTERKKLDADVLANLDEWSHKATYVIRNGLIRNGRKTLSTAQVLRACRRLEVKGLIKQTDHTSYVVMKVWEITPAGRASLAQGGDA
ncbi:hypothetical protein [Pseudochrobactrum lubricantis]|uniref:hypothetical protein n=1 Tax=Pseudochrobactrum lubricantis TaxID=558172 RepID=UPI0035D96FB1